MDFDHFQIKKWMLQLDWKKQMKKNEVLCLVSMFPFWVVVCKFSKKVHFLQRADLSKNLSLLKQFTYMHLKGFITLFQSMLWFIGVSATVYEI